MSDRCVTRHALRGELTLDTQALRLHHKFRSLVEPLAGREVSTRIIEQVDTLERGPNLAELISAITYFLSSGTESIGTKPCRFGISTWGTLSALATNSAGTT